MHIGALLNIPNNAIVTILQNIRTIIHKFLVCHIGRIFLFLFFVPANEGNPTTLKTIFAIRTKQENEKRNFIIFLTGIRKKAA